MSSRAGGRMAALVPRMAALVRFPAWVALLLIAPGTLGAAAQEPSAAQDRAGTGASDEGWNGPRVLDLVDRAHEARRDLVRDGDLESYRALTEGHIYFFVDPEEGERALIRADQVAVELRWRAPDQVQQHIIGERSETRLPVREFRYYLDRLTLVQYGFGDEIEVGSGMDVAGVPHPLAARPGEASGGGPYDFRLSDSLSVSLPGRADPVRLYEVEVRPRDPSAPGILGTIVLDRATASIVRMAFTFTPASYVDRRTDRISVELDYGLWEERYWLPNRQRIEVRRELPELDVGIGTVIRAVLRVGSYELNVPYGEMPVLGNRVTAVSREAREAYPFPEGLYDQLDRHGLEDVLLEVDPREIRARAVQLMREQSVSGLMPFRLHLPRVSEFVRFNRAEGLFLGMGATVRPRGDLRIRAHGGGSLGDGRGVGRGSLRVEGPLWEDTRWWAGVEANQLDDLGLVPGSDPLVSTLGALLRGEDYRDPYRVSAARVGLDQPFGQALVAEFTMGWERHRTMERSRTTAPLDGARAFREVRPVEDGRFFHLGVEIARAGIPWPGGGGGSARLGVDLRTGSAGEVGPQRMPPNRSRSGVGLQLGTTGRWGPPSGTRETRLDLDARTWVGDPLAQGHRLLGGRGTLPGYPYRIFAGEHLVRASVVHAADLWGPHLRIRAGLHGGWAGGLAPRVAEAWQVSETGNIRTSATLGLGIFWDLVRVEGARGFDGGEWQLLVTLDPRWWGLL